MIRWRADFLISLGFISKQNHFNPEWMWFR